MKHKLLFDHNLSTRLPDLFAEEFPDSKHVVDLDLQNKNDIEIWNYAKENEYVIVSKDKDFYHLSIQNGHPPKVIWFLVGNQKNKAIIDLLRNNLLYINKALDDNIPLIILKKDVLE
jgi:predicted nuclease of predicted toxin-antitoxin system